MTSCSDLSSQILPRHVAIIMDGNGRWAKKQGLPRFVGHQRGVEVARSIVIKAREIGIPYLSLFAFSKENWDRPSVEVQTLLSLLKEYLKKELPLLIEKEIRFKVIGDREDFPQDLQDLIAEVEEKTDKYSKMTLVIALSYSGRSEILKAIKKIAQMIKKGELDPEQISEETLRRAFYFPGLPDPDLLIRTSGELRISNFFLYQIAYTEFYFSDLLWPEFTPEEFLNAIRSFQKRERRFGKIYDF